MLGGLPGALVVVGGVAVPGPALADDPAPYASSSATRYQVTFAARSCGSYRDVVASQVRSDEGETLGRPGKVSAVREPSAGGGPLELPAQLAVARDVTEYTVSVTDEFGEPLTVATQASFFDQVRAVPIILVGIGVAGIGGLIFLALLLRHRST